MACSGEEEEDKKKSGTSQQSFSVGIQSDTLEDATRNRSMSVEIWFPTENDEDEPEITLNDYFIAHAFRDAAFVANNSRYPLLVLSHRHEGDLGELSWIAQHFADNNYVVLMVEHPGDTRSNQIPINQVAIWDRASDLSFAINELLQHPKFGDKINQQKIAALGYGAGGGSMMMLAGARLEFDALRVHCNANSDSKECAFFQGADVNSLNIVDSLGTFRDTRILAATALAPTWGKGFSESSFSSVTIPIQVIASRTDDHAPFSNNAERYDQLSTQVSLETHDGLPHFAFASECHQIDATASVEVCQQPDLDTRRFFQEQILPSIFSFIQAQLFPSDAE